MKPETMDKISALLKREMEEAKESLLVTIERDYKNEIEKKIAVYRDAYKAWLDFEEWREEQED